MIEVQELTVKVGEKRVLRDVNLRIETGTVVVLFGPNGCGKTPCSKPSWERSSTGWSPVGYSLRARTSPGLP